MSAQYLKFLTLKTVAVILLVVFLVASNAFAADFYFFRIDTELDVPAYYGSSGATVTYKCNGTGQGIVTDNTASESTQLLDGIIKIASTSVENDASHAGCNAGESITATASFSGWFSRTVTGTVSSAGTNTTFTTIASMDYTILVNGIADELGSGLTLNGTTASATYSGTVASQSYSGGKRYIAATTSGGTVKGGADGYVNRTSSALTVSSAASQSVDFGTTDSSTLNESGLLFSTKVTVNGTTRFGEAHNNVSGATVTAGNSNSVSCTDNSDGKYYCAVPLAHTGVTAQASVIPHGLEDASCTYTDRTTGGDTQSTCTVAAIEQGASGSDTPASTPTPLLTPTSIPSTTPTPVTSPEVTPSPLPLPAKLYRQAGDTKVYKQGADDILTWVRTLEEFNQAGYRWDEVRVVSKEEFSKFIFDSLSGTKLFRALNDTKVYAQSADEFLRWIKTAESFNAAGYLWTDIQEISAQELSTKTFAGNIQIVSDIGYLRIRSEPALSGNILGQALPGEILPFSRVSPDHWYRIIKDNLTGWIFGEYVSEI